MHLNPGLHPVLGCYALSGLGGFVHKGGNFALKSKTFLHLWLSPNAIIMVVDVWAA
jgi:hypothetical protein